MSASVFKDLLCGEVREDGEPSSGVSRGTGPLHNLGVEILVVVI